MNSLEIAILYRRIYILENINNVRNYNNVYYNCNINDFGITESNYMIFEKKYYYIKPKSSICINFSGYLISNGNANLNFRANILDDNRDILYSIDKNIDLNGKLNFDMNINLNDEILNANASIGYFSTKLHI